MFDCSKVLRIAWMCSYCTNNCSKTILIRTDVLKPNWAFAKIQTFWNIWAYSMIIYLIMYILDSSIRHIKLLFLKYVYGKLMLTGQNWEIFPWFLRPPPKVDMELVIWMSQRARSSTSLIYGFNSWWFGLNFLNQLFRIVFLPTPFHSSPSKKI